MSLILEFPRTWNESLPKTVTVKCHINLKRNSHAAFQHPYRARLKTRDHKSQANDPMLKECVIEPAMPEWAGCVVSTTKKHGKVRFCVVYRKISATIVRMRIRYHGGTCLLTRWEMQPSYVQLTATMGTGRLRYPRWALIELLSPAITGYSDLPGWDLE